MLAAQCLCDTIVALECFIHLRGWNWKLFLSFPYAMIAMSHVPCFKKKSIKALWAFCCPAPSFPIELSHFLPTTL